ncbi:MAG: hypothetical protein ACI8UO_004911 [Verrucomicrobiales bacterium]|jgi:hypothetical protein
MKSFEWLSRAGLGSAMLFSLASWLGLCEKCGEVRLNLPTSIGLVGAGVYAGLLAGSFTKFRVAFCCGVVFAFGVQLALAGYLVVTKQNCLICLGSFASVSVAAIASWFSVKPGWFEFLTSLLCGLIVAAGMLGIHQHRDRAYLDELKVEIGREIESLGFETAGALFVITETDCGHCQDFKRDILPGLRSQFGDSLRIEVIDGLASSCPVPSFYLVTADGPELFVGARTKSELAHLLESNGF